MLMGQTYLKSGYNYFYSAMIPPKWRNSAGSNVLIELSYAVYRCSQFRHLAHPQPTLLAISVLAEVVQPSLVRSPQSTLKRQNGPSNQWC
jgi:hypothetical protein